MSIKQCIIDGCTNLCVQGRRYCREHYLQRKRDQAKVRYNSSDFHRTMYEHVCKCGNTYVTTKKDSIDLCPECLSKARLKINQEINKYTYEVSNLSGKDAWKHKVLAKQYYGNISEGYVVHHINCIRNDNSKDNLAILSSSDHAKFHRLAELEYAKMLIYNPDANYFEFMKTFFHQYILNNTIDVKYFS